MIDSPSYTLNHEEVAKALEEYNKRLVRAEAYDRYFQLAQDWDVDGAEAAHRAEKEVPSP